MKIGILQTGRIIDALRETHGDFPDMMIRLLQDGDFIFQTFAVLDGVFPNNATECDDWLLTGSRHGAYDDLPWIATLESFLRAACAADVPIVGICFGHQIVAQALGGKVEKFPLGWAIGPTTYDFANGEKMVINAWHQDQVTRLPLGATCIATSEFCENAALVYGNRALTYQAHPFGPVGATDRAILPSPRYQTQNNALAQGTSPRPVSQEPIGDQNVPEDRSLAFKVGRSGLRSNPDCDQPRPDRTVRADRPRKARRTIAGQQNAHPRSTISAGTGRHACRL